MKIEKIKTEKLIPYARNSKKHDEIQISKLAGSIKEFGFNNPVLIDGENGIIAGHGRVMAAQKLELDEVPCIRLDHLTDVQRRAYILATNRRRRKQHEDTDT
jgi:ParB-like chromosome segregation protein Spo0J